MKSPTSAESNLPDRNMQFSVITFLVKEMSIKIALDKYCRLKDAEMKGVNSIPLNHERAMFEMKGTIHTTRAMKWKIVLSGILSQFFVLEKRIGFTLAPKFLVLFLNAQKLKPAKLKKKI